MDSPRDAFPVNGGGNTKETFTFADGLSTHKKPDKQRRRYSRRVPSDRISLLEIRPMIVKIVVENGIPIPKTAGEVVKEIPVLSSFLVANKKIAERFVNAAWQNDIKLACRKQENGTYRIWRLE